MTGERVAEVSSNERRPDFVGLPNVIHQLERFTFWPAIAQPPVEAEKCGYSHIGCAVHPDTPSLVRIHGGEKPVQIDNSGGAELNWNVHVLKSQGANGFRLVFE